MPVAPLLSSAFEALLNQLIKLDPDSQLQLKKLHGKSLQLDIKELPWPVLLQFSAHISVAVIASAAQTPADKADCNISLSMDTLPRLKDSSQLTQLIQERKLNLNGDIYVAQTFSDLLKDLNIDWEEQLSKYTGDVVAHQACYTAKSLFSQSKEALEKGREHWAKRLTEEQPIGVSSAVLSQFSEEVNQLRSATERLAARLTLLEKHHRG